MMPASYATEHGYGDQLPMTGPSIDPVYMALGVILKRL